MFASVVHRSPSQTKNEFNQFLMKYEKTLLVYISTKTNLIKQGILM